MPKYNVREKNPERYNEVYPQMLELWKKFRCATYAIRICPFCDQKLSLLFPGYHAPEMVKCPNCGEAIVFPAIKISRTITG